MPLYRLPAIVLRTYPFQETHLLVTLLTPSKGKIRALAKGCRKLQSALGRSIQPMVHAVFLLAEGKNLDCVTQGEIQTVFPKTRSELSRLTHGLYALELVERFVEEPLEEPRLFQLLLKTLQGLERGETPPLLLRGYEANLLKLLGYAPLLSHCGECKDFPEEARFSIRLGGILCEKCEGKDAQGIKLESGALKELRLCFAVAAGLPAPISPPFLPKIKGILQRFMEEKCGKSIHSFQLLEDVERLTAI